MIHQSEPWLGDEEIAQLTECIQSNWITSGIKVRAFEEAIANLCDVRRAVACTSGTTALFLAMRALGIGTHDEVIVPDFTFIASANSVALTGATPVFVDIKRDTLNIDPTLIEDAITPQTKAIMPVHLYGQSAEMDTILKIALRHGLFVVEDNAQGIGATWNGMPTGSMGHVSCLSFFADKALTTGEGGMVLTNSDDLADKCIRLSYQGNLNKGRYIHDTIGFNFRLTDLQAALGLAQLGKLQQIIQRRRSARDLYHDLLQSIVQFSKVDPRCFDVPFRVVMFGDDIEELHRFLGEAGIETRRVFYPLHMQPCYNVRGDFPNSVWAHDHGLSLPLSSQLTRNQVATVCNKVRAFYESGGP